MKALVDYECPQHGWLLATVPGAKVKCGKCKGDTAIKQSKTPGHSVGSVANPPPKQG